MSDPGALTPLPVPFLSERNKKKEKLNYTQPNHALQNVPSLVSTDSQQTWRELFLYAAARKRDSVAL